MAYTIRVEPAERRAIVLFIDGVEGKDIRDAVSELFSHEKWRSGYDVLYDGGLIDRLAVSPADVENTLDEFMSVTGGIGARRAAFVLRKEEYRALAHLFIAKLKRRHTGVAEMRVFADEEDASAWLSEGREEASDG